MLGLDLFVLDESFPVHYNIGGREINRWRYHTGDCANEWCGCFQKWVVIPFGGKK